MNDEQLCKAVTALTRILIEEGIKRGYWEVVDPMDGRMSLKLGRKAPLVYIDTIDQLRAFGNVASVGLENGRTVD